MKYEINSQTKEIIESFNLTSEMKDFILQHIEDSYYRGHTDGYLDGYNRGYEEGHESGFSEGFDEAERQQQEQLDI